MLQGTQLGSVSGVVSGSDGAPITDAHVEVRDEQTGRTVATGYTNGAGAFEFNNLPLAPYDIVAVRGLAEAHEHLTSSDMSGSLKLRLNTANGANQVDGQATVSVAEYRVPQKARDAFHKAQVAVEKSKRDEAKKQLAKALELYPDYASALTLRGVLSLDDDKTQDAIDDFDHAIHADPSFAMAYTGMSAALNQSQKFDDAIRSADRAVSLAPQSWQSYFEIAKAFIGKGDYRDAISKLDKAQELLPVPYAQLHLVRAHALLALHDYNNATTELEAFLRLAPQDPNSGIARRALEKVKALTAAATTPPPVANAVR